MGNQASASSLIIAEDAGSYIYTAYAVGIIQIRTIQCIMICGHSGKRDVSVGVGVQAIRGIIVEGIRAGQADRGGGGIRANEDDAARSTVFQESAIKVTIVIGGDAVERDFAVGIDLQPIIFIVVESIGAGQADRAGARAIIQVSAITTRVV